VPDSIIAPKRDLNICDADWRRIENAYGHELSDRVRSAIIESTQEFIGWEMAEHEAKPVAEGKQQIETWKRAAGELRKRLNWEEDRTGGVMRLLVNRNFKARFGRRVTEPFFFLDQALTDFERACDKALSKLRPEPTILTLRAGDAWQVWIRQLCEIMKENSLPCSVRKDSDKSAKLSPFVVLVRELQKCLPKETAFPAHSDRALAEAIGRARRPSGHKRVARRPE
jgi:hypothetical protein